MAPPARGLHTCYNGAHAKGKRPRESKADLIKCVVVGLSLQLDSMKSESLVIVDQNATVNTFPGLVHTARHHGSRLQSKSSLTFRGGRLPFVIHG